MVSGLGSSPLTRGKQQARRRSRGHPGLIPAHAGKTARPPMPSPRSRAHPRSRGENRLRRMQVARSGGSSPLTRGKRGHAGRPEQRRRLIPAHAGKTCRCLSCLRRPRAHPRSRGENKRVRGELGEIKGSSPLTRGKPHLCAHLEMRLRLIPAHAGKTQWRSRTWQPSEAHPRSRGENRTMTLRLERDGGSSPLTRGKRDLQRRLIRRVRLIPAHAGKTRSRRSELRTWGAHPRSRGENVGYSLEAAPISGSSPLTRGKPRRRHRPGTGRRLIPAHAGKTATMTSAAVLVWAHPRSRGENGGSGSFGGSGSGSSPLTRGKLHGGSLVCVPGGLIPAHAGKTTQQQLVDVHEGAHPRSRGEN